MTTISNDAISARRETQLVPEHCLKWPSIFTTFHLVVFLPLCHLPCCCYLMSLQRSACSICPVVVDGFMRGQSPIFLTLLLGQIFWPLPTAFRKVNGREIGACEAKERKAEMPQGEPKPKEEERTIRDWGGIEAGSGLDPHGRSRRRLESLWRKKVLLPACPHLLSFSSLLLPFFPSNLPSTLAPSTISFWTWCSPLLTYVSYVSVSHLGSLFKIMYKYT